MFVVYYSKLKKSTEMHKSFPFGIKIFPNGAIGG
jgi:hypothetical protein